MTRRRQTPRELLTLLLILAAAGALALTTPAFREPLNLTTLGKDAAILALMACGEGLVILGGGLDLSVGATMALSSCTAAELLAAGVSWPLAALGGLAAAACAGLVNGALITYRKLPPILTTLATLLIFRYGASIATHARSFGPFPDNFNRIAAGWVPAVVGGVVVLAFMALTLRAPLGRRTIAMGGSEQAVRLSGVSTDGLKRWGYLLCALCAGLAGLIAMAFNNNTQSDLGTGMELSVIAACVVGGVRITGGEGSILGASLGAMLIALAPDALVLTNRPAEQYGLVTGAVVLAAAALEQIRARRAERARVGAGA